MSLSVSDVAQLYRNQGREVPAEFHGEKEIRAHKYGRIQKMVDGILFDSTLEADAWPILKLWAVSGVIQGLERQPVFVLQEKVMFPEPFVVRVGAAVKVQRCMRKIKYVADFAFMQDGKRVVVDAKGIQTAAFRIKAKLFRAKFPEIDLQIWDRAKVKELSRA